MVYSKSNKSTAETAQELGHQHPNLSEISQIFVSWTMRQLKTTSFFHTKPGHGRNHL